jgi:hypothetical protein
VRFFLIAALTAGLIAPAGAQTGAQTSAAPPAATTAAAAPAAADATTLMRQGRYAEALLMLERQVLLEPLNAGAWLDFAISHYQLGDFAESQALFDAIEREFSPSPAIRAVIARYRERPKPSLLPTTKRWSADLALLAGRETNANAGLRLSSLTLTLADTAVLLAIDPRYQAHPSSTTQLVGHAEGELPLGESGVSLLGVGEWRDRRTPDTPDFGTRQYQGFVGLRGPLSAVAAAQWALWGGLQHASLGGQGLLDANRLLATLEVPLAGCQARGGGEIERRRYPIQPALDGRYQGLLGSLGCPALGGQVFLTARYGEDRPDGTRAGGDQTRADLAALVQFPLFGRGRLEAGLNRSLQWDRQAYSVLLGDTPRRIDRSGLTLEYAHPIRPGLEWLLRAESWAQSSNIELFRLRNNSLLAGLRQRF